MSSDILSEALGPVLRFLPMVSSGLLLGYSVGVRSSVEVSSGFCFASDLYLLMAAKKLNQLYSVLGDRRHRFSALVEGCHNLS